jgi:regulator of protease activity HflC (stomatin/prohibitin superfamily)
MASRGLQFVYAAAIPTAIGVSLLQSSIYDVKGGSRAVIFDRVSGVKETVVNEGTHFLIPWLQKAIVFDVRTKPRIIPTTTGSKDLQMVSLTLRVLHRPEVQALPKIYQVRIYFISLLPGPPSESVILTKHPPSHRTSAKITTNVCSPRSATKCSSRSWPSSTPPS